MKKQMTDEDLEFLISGRRPSQSPDPVRAPPQQTQTEHSSPVYQDDIDDLLNEIGGFGHSDSSPSPFMSPDAYHHATRDRVGIKN